jgi:hypothetical protein
MFSLEKLKVYDRALGCVANLAQLSVKTGQRGLALVERVGILVRGLVEHA